VLIIPTLSNSCFVQIQKNESQLLQTHNAVAAADDDDSVCIDLRFGVQHRYDLRHVFPLLTTKRVFWRGVF
jgi:thymidylate synthase